MGCAVGHHPGGRTTAKTSTGHEKHVDAHLHNLQCSFMETARIAHRIGGDVPLRIISIMGCPIN